MRIARSIADAVRRLTAGIVILVMAGLTGTICSSADPKPLEPWVVLLQQADSLRKATDYDSALVCAEQAYLIAERDYGLGDTSVARADHYIGTINYYRGDYNKADSAWTRALAVRETVLGREHPDVGITLHGMATLYVRQGRFVDADNFFQRVLQIRERTLGPDHPDVALSLISLAGLYFEQGRYSDAEPLYLRALQIQETKLGPENIVITWTLNKLANLYYNQGRGADAEPLHLRALKIREAVRGMEHIDVVVSLNNLGYLYVDQERYAEAEPLFLRALKIVEKTFGENHINVIASLNGLALAYSSQTRYTDAEPLYLRCLRIWAGETTSAQPKVASTLDNLANLYVNQGRYAEADSLYIRALEIWKESARDHHPLAAYAFSDYALSAQLQHDFVNASARARKAWNIRRSNFEDGGTVLAERAAYENAKFLVTETDNYLTVLTAGRAQLPERVSAVAGVVLSSKGIVTDVMAERYAIAVDEGGEAVQRIAEALREARFKLATLQLEEGASDASAYEDNLAATTKEKERLEVELARQSPTFQSKQQRWHVQTTDIADALPPNSVLVEYMRYEHRLSFREREARFIAVVLRKDREPDVVELGRADSIETAVKWYRSHFANFGAQIPADYDEISRDLYRLIWAPLDSLVRGHDAVFVAPDGELNLVAFAGLKRPDGRYLVEDFALHYLATGRDLIRLSYEPRGESFELLALGDPAFDATMEERCSESANPVNVDSSGKLGSAARRNARSGCEALQERNWSSLAATRAEVTQLVEIWATRGITSNVFTGAQASEERFKRESGGKRIIHLATHGFYVGEECRRKLSGNPSAVVKLGENPMLQSGFVLAGANLRKSWSDSTSLEDGIVTAEEVVGLDLHTTDLVVLSACETGLGDVKAGEGVFGLRRAFQLAGARTIISTLWPVEDQDAADLASGLLAAGYPLTIESVRAATLRQLWARRSAGLSDHPYYWAGFIVSGDWK